MTKRPVYGELTEVREFRVVSEPDGEYIEPGHEKVITRTEFSDAVMFFTRKRIYMAPPVKGSADR